jgi:putative transcriptional regulator
MLRIRHAWRPTKPDRRRGAFAVLLLVSMLSWPAAADGPPSMTAILITARADLPDPNFRDAVVLVTNGLGPGPAGVILNRPTRIGVAELFPEVKALAHRDDKVYFGGPLDITSVLFLFRAATPPEHALQVQDGIYLSGDLDLLHKLFARAKPLDGLRVFIGYSSWGPGQLQGEIARGDWTLAPASSAAIFGRRAEHPWPQPPEPDDARRI